MNRHALQPSQDQVIPSVSDSRDSRRYRQRDDAWRTGAAWAQSSWLGTNRIPPVAGDLWLVCGILLAALLSTVAILALGPVRFVVYSPPPNVDFHMLLGIASIFAAIILRFAPDEHAGIRLRWVSLGFLILGLGNVLFGYVLAWLNWSLDLNTALYASLLIHTVVTALFAYGLLSRVAPRLSLHVAVGAVFLVGLVSLLLASLDAEDLPRLLGDSTFDTAGPPAQSMARILTASYWVFAPIPLILAGAAAVGAALRYPGRAFAGWLVMSMSLNMAAQIHDLFWPAAYQPLVATSSLLQLAAITVICVGGVVEPRRIVRQWAGQAHAEHERASRLAELVNFKADFTTMVAHELSSPILAIRRCADLLAIDSTAEQGRLLATIQAEIDLLNALVADVRAIADVERDSLQIRMEPTNLRALLEEAAAFTRSLSADHPIQITFTGPDKVWADPERIQQVLHNLLHNAVKYSPPGSGIHLRAAAEGSRIRIEVVDSGYGIHPDDLTRIFHKFERAQQQDTTTVPGLGIGLYLSQQIVRAHGDQLTVRSIPGVGSAFAFSLKVAR